MACADFGERNHAQCRPTRIRDSRGLFDRPVRKLTYVTKNTLIQRISRPGH